MAAYLVVAVLVVAGAAVHVQLWRVRRRFGKSSKLTLTPEQKRNRVRLSMAVTWGFAVAALVGWLAAQHGYYWVTPLFFAILALGLRRVAKTKWSVEVEEKVRKDPEPGREPSVWDAPSGGWGFEDDKKA